MIPFLENVRGLNVEYVLQTPNVYVLRAALVITLERILPKQNHCSFQELETWLENDCFGGEKGWKYLIAKKSRAMAAAQRVRSATSVATDGTKVELRRTPSNRHIVADAKQLVFKTSSLALLRAKGKSCGYTIDVRMS